MATQAAPTMINYDTPTSPVDLPPASDARAYSDRQPPGAFVPDEDRYYTPLNSSGADVPRKPSVGIAPNPVSRNAPSDGDEPERNRSAHRRSTSLAVTSDSGYASAGGRGNENEAGGHRAQSRTSEGSAGIAPIPILWTDSSHARGGQTQAMPDEYAAPERERRESPFKRAASLRSFRASTMGGERERDRDRDGEERGSVRTAPSVGAGASGLRRRRTSLTGGSFSSGPGMVGPAASPALDDQFHERSRSADLGLSERQRVKLSKGQIKEGKRVAKIIYAEGKAEQKALDDAVKELSDLQKLQKTAVKEESRAYTTYSKALREFHRVELEFFAARAKYERAQADVQAQEDAREASRAHAREITEMLQEKNREVEWLRAQKAVDDREREAKVRQLTGK